MADDLGAILRQQDYLKAFSFFSFSAFIGIIALVGVVVNDAIVMVDTMNGYQEGMSKRQAAASGVSDRLRPIITTSITTIIGLIPLAPSDPTWKPLCSAIIFGLLAATVIALYCRSRTIFIADTKDGKS